MPWPKRLETMAKAFRSLRKLWKTKRFFFSFEKFLRFTDDGKRHERNLNSWTNESREQMFVSWRSKNIAVNSEKKKKKTWKLSRFFIENQREKEKNEQFPSGFFGHVVLKRKANKNSRWKSTWFFFENERDFRRCNAQCHDELFWWWSSPKFQWEKIQRWQNLRSKTNEYRHLTYLNTCPNWNTMSFVCVDRRKEETYRLAQRVELANHWTS